MKELKKIILMLLALLCLLFGATACQSKEQTPATDPEKEALASKVILLESELQKLREEGFTQKTDYEQQIRSLQEKMAALSGQTAASGQSFGGSESMIFQYKIEEEKAIITGFAGNATFVTIPATLKGYPVCEIGEHAFEGTQIAGIKLSEGIEKIGWFAFYGCENLREIEIPSSVTCIGYGVFDGCEQLTISCFSDSYAAKFAKSYGLPLICPDKT